MADTPVNAPQTPDYTTQSPTPPVTPNANNTLAGLKPQPATFKGSFVQGLKGPQYTTDESGNLIPVSTGAPSGRGLLGSVLAGAVMGALHGASATRKGERGGVAFASGVRADQQIRDQQKQKAEAVAQQSFQNQQSTQKLNMEQQAAQDAHNTAVLNANHLTALTAGLVQSTQYEKELHPLEVQAKKLGLDETAAQLTNTKQQIEKNGFDLAQNLSAMNIDPTAVINSWGDANGQLKGVMAGTHTALPNGLPSSDEKFGANMYSMGDLNRPLMKDVSYYTYDTTDKNGNPVPTKHTLVADGNNTVSQYVAAAMQGQSHLLQNEALLKSKIDNAEKEAQTSKAKNEGFKAYGEGLLAKANADQLAKYGFDVPTNYTFPSNGFQMDPATLQTSLQNQGVKIVPNFQTLYAIGHSDLDLKTEAQRLYKGGAGMTQDQAATYIKTYINPNFHEQNYDAVKIMDKEFADTRPNTAGGNLISFNAATQHLGQLWDAMDALSNSDLPRVNSLVNTIKSETGSPVKPTFDSIKAVLTGEIGKTIKGAAATDPEIEALNQTLNSSQSPAALQGAARAYAHTMLTKAGALAQHYYDYTGKLPPQTIDPKSADVYQKMGINLSDVLPAGATKSVGATANPNPTQPQSQPQAVVVNGKVIGTSTDGGKTMTPIQGNPQWQNQTIQVQ